MAVAAAALCALATACEDDPSQQPAATPTPATAADPASPWEDEFDSADPFTALVVQLSWEQQTSQDKQAMCSDISMYGVDWAASALEEGDTTPYKDTGMINWKRAAEMIEERCRVEGY